MLILILRHQGLEFSEKAGECAVIESCSNTNISCNDIHTPLFAVTNRIDEPVTPQSTPVEYRRPYRSRERTQNLLTFDNVSITFVVSAHCTIEIWIIVDMRCLDEEDEESVCQLL